VKRLCLFVLALTLIGVPQAVFGGQTQHGVELTITPGPQPTGALPVAGYNIYRCAGTCPTPTIPLTAGSGWAKIDTSLDLSTGYLDVSSDLISGTVYNYFATAVDTSANESGPSPIATVTWPSTPPVNPGSPSGCSGKVQ
jgi:hypothetical protein